MGFESLSRSLARRPDQPAGNRKRRAAERRPFAFPELALASDTLSIGTMEVVDNALILLVPGAMAAGLGSGLFWWSLAAGLAVAFVVTVPVNRWLIARGRGHAVVHALHGH